MNVNAMLHIDSETRALAYILGGEDFDEQMDVFIADCEALSRSIGFHNPDISFSVLTIDLAFIESRRRGYTAIQIPFPIYIIKGIPFYSAHHKYDAFSWLAENADGYSILVDYDMVCINTLPKDFEACIK